MLRSALLPLVLLVSTAAQAAKAPDEPRVLSVRQAAPADLVGDDDVAIKAACDRLRKTGGTIVLGPGRYVVRRSIILPANIVVRGESGAILALPAPVLTATVALAGSRELEIDGPHEFDCLGGPILLQILPPVGSDFFADGVTGFLDLQRATRVEGPKITLARPLALDVPAGSRVGYPLKIFQTHPDGLATLENLAFEGGRVPAIPMPGHSQRCALWASSPYVPEAKERPGPPGRGVVVRHCRFSDWYGRAVALYYQVDGLVEGCLMERIADEAIDLDHFVEGFRIVGNEVRDARFGIVLNDASRNLVEYNRVDGGEIGIYAWWYDRVIADGVNEENVIRHNLVQGTRLAPIHTKQTCVRFTIQHNFVEGEIVVEEADNLVGPNTRLDAPR